MKKKITPKFKNLIPVVIDNRTTIYIEPGKSKKLAKKKYLENVEKSRFGISKQNKKDFLK